MNKYLKDGISIEQFTSDFIEFCKPYKHYDNKDSNESVFVEDLQYFLIKNAE